MPIYRAIEDENAVVLRIRNLILLPSNQGVTPSELSERLQAFPGSLVDRAISELVQEGKLELSNHNQG